MLKQIAESTHMVNDKNFEIPFTSIVLLCGLIDVIPFMISQNTYAIAEGKCHDMNLLWGHAYEHRICNKKH
jgi:hypothetical protein